MGFTVIVILKELFGKIFLNMNQTEAIICFVNTLSMKLLANLLVCSQFSTFNISKIIFKLPISAVSCREEGRSQKVPPD